MALYVQKYSIRSQFCKDKPNMRYIVPGSHCNGDKCTTERLSIMSCCNKEEKKKKKGNCCLFTGKTKQVL